MIKFNIKPYMIMYKLYIIMYNLYTIIYNFFYAGLESLTTYCMIIERRTLSFFEKLLK